MANKIIKFNFFRLDPKSTLVPSTQIVKNISTVLRSSSNRTILGNNRAIWLDKVRNRKTHFVGTIIVSNMKDIPAKSDYKSKLFVPVDLNETEGLEKNASFLYDPQSNVVMLESTVVVNSLCGYLSDHGVPRLTPSIVINPAELQKFYNMERITQFHVKIATVENGNIYNQEDSSVLQVIQSAADTNTDVLDVTMSVQPRRTENTSLNISTVQKMVKGFLKFKSKEEVLKLEVKGGEEKGKTIPINLIEQRLHETIQIDKDARHSTIFSIQEKYSEMERVFEHHRQELIRFYQKLK